MTEAQLKRAAEIHKTRDAINATLLHNSQFDGINGHELKACVYGKEQVKRLKQFLKAELARLKEEAEKL